MQFEWILTLPLLVVGATLVWWLGARRKSLIGAVVPMVLTIVGATVVQTELAEQISTLMLGVSIVMMLVGFVLIGWLWNVIELVRWRRLQGRAEGGPWRESLANEVANTQWMPWVAWYPVETEKGSAWMRRVQARRRAMCAKDGPVSYRMEFREIPST